MAELELAEGLLQAALDSSGSSGLLTLLGSDPSNWCLLRARCSGIVGKRQG